MKSMGCSVIVASLGDMRSSHSLAFLRCGIGRVGSDDGAGDGSWVLSWGRV